MMQHEIAETSATHHVLHLLHTDASGVIRHTPSHGGPFMTDYFGIPPNLAVQIQFRKLPGVAD